ncbi:Ribosomal RNA-processing protein 8 [Fasciola gigantica]|uniref:Ribosomal RNA-processing protein 8 n=1 Tax=Fasciola gigantica TaxID=46835 RepID=A0A504Y4J0_FASGI|nr:Ribosomal RNA-processing protein 8 [Fasciola gigantica]
MRKSEIRKLKRLMKSAPKKVNTKRKVRKRSAKLCASDTGNLINGITKKTHSSDSFEALIHSSMFRFLNEKLYTCSSEEAMSLFEEDPKAFEVYHTGFQQQLAQWPDDPLLWILNYLNQVPDSEKKTRIADMGCGDARLALAVTGNKKVYSFDLIAVNKRVTACDMAHTPLKSSHVHFVIFCLSLMGINCRDFIYEANRILKTK